MDDPDRLVAPVRETERHRVLALMQDGLGMLLKVMARVISHIPKGTSRARGAGVTVARALRLAPATGVAFESAQAAVEAAKDASGDTEVRSVAARQALSAMLQVAVLAGMAHAYADMASERKKASARRMPTEIDRLVEQFAKEDMPATKAAELMRGKHRVPRGQVHLERRIRAARKKLPTK